MTRTKVFLSYRRDDAAAYANRLHESLSADFGVDGVFVDVFGTAPGAKFDEVLQDAIAQCDAFLPLIGSGWLSASDSLGRRLFRADDRVRLEIAAALRRDVLLIPVLLGGARMPLREDLPSDIQGLTLRHAIILSDDAWQAGILELKRSLQSVVPAAHGLVQKLIEQKYCKWCGKETSRLPSNWRETMRGGWTCRNCGAKFNRWGRLLTKPPTARP